MYSGQTPQSNQSTNQLTQVNIKNMAIHKVHTESEDDDNDPQPTLRPQDLIKKIAAEAKSAFKQPDPGIYSAIVTKVEMVQYEKGLFIRPSYILDYRNSDDTKPLFRHSQLFQMTEKDCRTPNEWGPDFYNRFMAKLGFAQDNRGEEAWDEIADTQPGVALKITIARDPEYRNTAITGPLDDDDEGISFIREFLETHPF